MIEQFSVNVPQQVLDDLKARISNTRWTDLPKGGHFAAMEQTNLLANDIIQFAEQVLKVRK